ncbi:hypothetical protein ACJZ2D_014831 [Fusarium nematophilum]
MDDCPLSLKMDVDHEVQAMPGDTPAAYLHLVDTRSHHQSQRTSIQELTIPISAIHPSPPILVALLISLELLPIWDQEILKIGRDPGSNTLAVENDDEFMVSRNHCEVYVVVYEPTVNHVYVRDRKSCNGTFVNGQLIGSGPEISPGYLLQHGDVIEIQPSRVQGIFGMTPLVSDQTVDISMQHFAHRYEVTDYCLGRGAEAVVCLAKDVSTGKQLVCKLVNLAKIQGKNSEEDIRRKFQEADILRQLRHASSMPMHSLVIANLIQPNILPYVDAISSPHSLYTFTELASGGDLMSFLLRHGTVKEFDSRIIIRQVVRGLRYLHEKDIVHRDLKPENILLAYSPRVAYHRIMLSDFGISAVPRCSRMMTNAGTTGYQAPEFVAGGDLHTLQVDIWSLGVVALLLMVSDSHHADINRMGQEELGNYLCQLFFDLQKQPSQNGSDFIWSCLQIKPTMRMNTREAEQHAWLCTPEEHLQFFELLDKRMMANWKPQDKFKPMPWKLPNLAWPGLATPGRDSGQWTSRFFTPEAGAPARSTTPVENPDGNNGRDPRDKTTENSSEKDASAFVVPTRPASASANGVKRPYPPWYKFSKPSRLARPESQPIRKRATNIRVADTALLPLPGLDRHLRPPINHRHRQDILWKLEKSNSKFLVDQAPMSPSPTHGSA